MEITTPHGAMSAKSQTHNIDFYHLDTMIVIGYRKNSTRQQIVRAFVFHGSSSTQFSFYMPIKFQ